MPIILFISVQYYVQAFCYSEWRPWSPHDSVSLSQASRQARGHRTQGTYMYFKSKHGNLTNALFSHNFRWNPGTMHNYVSIYLFAAHTGCHAGESWGDKQFEGLWPQGTHWGERERERETMYRNWCFENEWSKLIVTQFSLRCTIFLSLFKRSRPYTTFVSMSWFARSAFSVWREESYWPASERDTPTCSTEYQDKWKGRHL